MKEENEKLKGRIIEISLAGLAESLTGADVERRLYVRWRTLFWRKRITQNTIPLTR
jgi:hypothetical protein